MNYIQVDLKISPLKEGRDICMAFLSDIQFETFQETDDGLVAFMRSEEFDEKELQKSIKNIPNHSVAYSFKEIEQVNWNKKWESNFDPIQISDNCVIRAPFHEKQNVKYDLIIMPKMSFGTGHHSTTTLMMRALLKENIEGMKVMDAGCGTSVLAIMAEKLQAKSVLAYDIDDWAVNNSKENVGVNNCKYINVEKGSVKEIADTGFNVILANINKNVLLEEMEDYSKKLVEDGILFLSGFYESDVEDVAKAASFFGLDELHSETLNEWAIIKLQKRVNTDN